MSPSHQCVSEYLQANYPLYQFEDQFVRRMLACGTSGMIREVGVVCTGVSDSGADGVTGEMCTLFGVLEK